MCSLIKASELATVDRIGFDWLRPGENENLVMLRSEDWEFSSYVIGLTTVSFNQLTGEIIDADIEFNAQGLQAFPSPKPPASLLT